MKYDIEALKRKMLVKYPFFGSVVASVDYKENKSISTAGTNGETIYYNPEYLESLSVEEQTFIFAHEVCHIAFNHILRSEGKDQKLWNVATDGVINQFLKRDGLKLAPGVVDMAEAINYDAEQLYEKLLQEKQQRESQQQNQENQQQNGSSEQSEDQQQTQSQQQNDSSEQSEDQQQTQSDQQSSFGGESSQQQSGSESSEDSQEEQQDVGHDTHNMWEQAVKKHKEQQEKSDEKGSSDKLLEKDEDKKEKEKTKLEKEQETLEGMGEKEAFDKNLEEKKRQLEELKDAISKQAAQAGTTTNSVDRNVSDIGTARPIVDWRYVLREAAKYDVDWSYRNAIIDNGVVVANLEEQPISETEIVLDTSGSVDETLLKNFLRECKNILQHTKLKVGCFDTKFYGFYEIETEEDIENMQFKGGGGTDFNVALNAFSRRVENKIIFTDGNAPMPDMPLDAIWIVFGGEKINPKGGRVIHITPEKLNRLYSCEIEYETKGRLR